MKRPRRPLPTSRADPAGAGDETAGERLPDLGAVALPAAVAAGTGRGGPLAVLSVATWP